MTETTGTTSAAAPHFMHISSPAAILASPLPPRLEAELPSAERKRHGEIVARSEEASRTIARLRQEIVQAPAADRAAAAEAALAGEEIPEPSLGRLRQEFEQAQTAKAALDDALRRPADSLLAAVVGKAEPVAVEVEQERVEATEAIRARLADAEQALRELGQLFAEEAWARGVAHTAEEGRR